MRNHCYTKHKSFLVVENVDIESVSISDENYCSDVNSSQNVITNSVSFDESVIYDLSDESVTYDSSEEYDFKDMYSIPLLCEPLKNIAVKYCASI